MRKRDLARFEKLLLQEQERLSEQQGKLANLARRTMRESSGELSAYRFHMADLGTDAMEREQSFLLASNLRRTLEDVEESLRRIKSGEYGICEICEKAIDLKRLRALPYARCCLACQETKDRTEDISGRTGRS